MSTPFKSILDYYLVPFGRERGGYLELLKLPPDVRDTEVRKRDGEFRLEIQKELKVSRKGLKEKHQKGELTQEELDAQIKGLQDEATKKETLLNELKTSYEVLQSERRKLANEGREVNTVAWQPMFCLPDDSPETFWTAILARRAPGAVDPEFLHAVQTRWVTDPHPFLLLGPGRNGADAADAVLLALTAPTGRRPDDKFAQDHFSGLARDRRGRLEGWARHGRVSQSAVGPLRQRIDAQARQGYTLFQSLREEYAATGFKDTAYLELLGLPPDAPEAEIRKRDEGYRLEARKAWQRAQKSLQEKRDKGQLPPAEFDREAATLKEEHRRKLERLDRLRARAEDLAARGRAWRQRHGRDGGEGAPRPAESKSPPAAAALARPTASLAELAGFVLERDLIPLLAADSLWGEVPYTNRCHWGAQVSLWAEEYAARQPRPRPTAVDPAAVGAPPPFPELCGPPARAIDRLPEGDNSALTQGPDRTRAKAALSPEQLLAQLLGEGGDGETGRRPVNVDELESLLEKMSRLESEQNK